MSMTNFDPWFAAKNHWCRCKQVVGRIEIKNIWLGKATIYVDVISKISRFQIDANRVGQYHAPSHLRPLGEIFGD